MIIMNILLKEGKFIIVGKLKDLGLYKVLNKNIEKVVCKVLI